MLDLSPWEDQLMKTEYALAIATFVGIGIGDVEQSASNSSVFQSRHRGV